MVAEYPNSNSSVISVLSVVNQFLYRSRMNSAIAA
jgi:hypothetical protein